MKRRLSIHLISSWSLFVATFINLQSIFVAHAGFFHKNLIWNKKYDIQRIRHISDPCFKTRTVTSYLFPIKQPFPTYSHVKTSISSSNTAASDNSAVKDFLNTLYEWNSDFPLTFKQKLPLNVFPYTNPSILKSMEEEAAQKEYVFWWTDTVPRLTNINTDTRVPNTEINSENSLFLCLKEEVQALEEKYLEHVERVIGEDMIHYIAHLVQLRSKARLEGSYDISDDIKAHIQNITLVQLSDMSNFEKSLMDDVNDNHENRGSGSNAYKYMIEIKDLPRRCGGGSLWKFTRKNVESNNDNGAGDNNEQDSFMDTNVNNKNRNDKKQFNSDSMTVLQIAHSALGMVAFASEHNIDVNEIEFHKLIQLAETRLTQNTNVLDELRGRKASDAAFWFALAGVTSPIIFDHLIQISCFELDRFGRRSTCRAKDIFHIVEHIAASGATISTTPSIESSVGNQNNVIVEHERKDQNSILTHLYNVAADCLEFKLMENSNGKTGVKVDSEMIDSINALKEANFHLHSTRPLLWIWKFSTKQRKQNTFLKQASHHWKTQLLKKDDGTVEYSEKELRTQSQHDFEWTEIFIDPMRPLVIDIGCGMGISLLGLASLKKNSLNNDMYASTLLPFSHDTELDIEVNWEDCNFLGGDLSPLTIGYAKGIAKRWNISENTSFTVESAEKMMEEVAKSYPGKIILIMIQFPTPFRLKQREVPHDHSMENNDMNQNLDKNGGNSQLPSNIKSGFMVTERLLQLCHTALGMGTSKSKLKHGKLLLQSNCEDVAVEMRNMATSENVGFRSLPVLHPMPLIQESEISSNSDDSTTVQITKRTQDWINIGKSNYIDVERAEGSDWSKEALLPKKGATETEVACILNGTPIHRCLLEVKNKIND